MLSSTAMEHMFGPMRPATTGSDAANGSPDKSARASQILHLADGRQIGFAEYGDPHGLPVLAFHGTPGSRFMFALADKAAYKRRLRIIAPERPGYGLSDFLRQTSLTESAGDLEALADRLKLDRFALIGVSGGGPFAVAAACAMPDRVALLALMDPVGPVADSGGRIHMSWLHRFIFMRLARSPAACAAFFGPLRTLVRFAPSLAHRALMLRVPRSDRTVLADEEVRANLRTALGEGLRPGIRGALQDLRLYCAPWGLALDEVGMPAILWQGSDDTIVPPEAAYDLADTLPNCRLEVVEACGHYWMFKQFERALDAAEAALRQTAPQP
jgi:pimeloyl-ACP methyl ester carboxylesterase